MPIGTKSTALLLEVYKPKITRLPKKQEQKNFWWLLLQTVLITAIATAAGAVTGGLASSAALAFGSTDFIAGITSFSTQVIVDFAINQTIDEIQEQSSVNNTILNLLLPIAFNANLVTRGYRMTKILKLAKNSKTLEKLGINEAKNIQQIINKLNGTKLLTENINGKRQLFNFEKLNREKLLQNIGFISQQRFRYNFKNFTIDEIKENLLLQVNLAKLSPKLLPNLKIKNIENVNDFLTKFGTDYKTVIKMNQFDWLNLISEIQKTNSGKALVLTLQQIRNTTVKYSFNSKILSNSINKINRVFRYFDFNYFINKGLQKFWDNTPYFSKLKEKILILQQKIEKIESKVLSKLEKLKIDSKALFSKTEKNIINKFNLIPLISQVFLACKIEPVTVTNCVITIFYKDERYDPIVVTDTIAKAEIFISQPHPFSWYWHQSGWALGYGISKNNIIFLINLLPGTAKKAAKEALKINFQIKSIKRKYHMLSKGLINQNINKILFNQGLIFITRNIFKNKSTKLLSNLIRQRKNYKQAIINHSAHRIKKNINKRIKR